MHEHIENDYTMRYYNKSMHVFKASINDIIAWMMTQKKRKVSHTHQSHACTEEILLNFLIFVYTTVICIAIRIGVLCSLKIS